MQTATQIERDIESVHAFSISLNLLDGYAFRADFDDASLEPLHTDEPRPLGSGSGPSPSRLLAAAVTNCLASSMLHCLRRSRVEVKDLKARATVTVGRNKRGRVRIERIAVQLEPTVAAAHVDQLSRCTNVFEDYCTVTASIRDGIEIGVSVAANAAKPWEEK
ncbi:MAG: OsmC family protein [Gemmatimonadaceae bacterium]